MKTQLQAISFFFVEITNLVLSYVDSGRLTGIQPVTFHTKVKKRPTMQRSGLWEVNMAVAEEESML